MNCAIESRLMYVEGSSSILHEPKLIIPISGQPSSTVPKSISKRKEIGICFTNTLAFAQIISIRHSSSLTPFGLSSRRRLLSLNHDFLPIHNIQSLLHAIDTLPVEVVIFTITVFFFYRILFDVVYPNNQWVI